MSLQAAARGVLWNKVSLKISQNAEENTGARVSFLINLQAVPETLLKKRLWCRCFPVNFAKFLRTPFFYRTPPDDCFCISISYNGSTTLTSSLANSCLEMSAEWLKAEITCLNNLKSP